jgi:hypothetical protein
MSDTKRSALSLSMLTCKIGCELSAFEYCCSDGFKCQTLGMVPGLDDPNYAGGALAGFTVASVT